VNESSSDPGRPRRVVVLAGGGPGRRLDIPVHAAAQLPEGVELAVRSGGPESNRLTDLARAYGIEARIRVRPDVSADQSDVTLVQAPGADTPPRAGTDPSLGWRIETSSGTRTAATMAELVEGLTEPDDPPASARPDDDAFAGQRIALVTNLPTHYRVPLFNAAARRLRKADADLAVIFTAGQSEETRPWLRGGEPEFDHVFLDHGTGRVGRKAPRDLGRELRRIGPTMVIAGGFAPGTAGRAAWFAARRGLPFGIWSGETHRQMTARSAVRLLERRWIARRASFAIAYGWLSLEYMRALAPWLPAVIGRNTAPFASPEGASQGGAELQFLAVAQAIPRKGLDVLVDAFRRLEDVPCRLTIAGGGSVLDDLVARAAGLSSVAFLGPVDSAEVLERYRRADAFLFPSRSDVFGLALVEGMGAGLPTITAAAPGAVPDLGMDRRNCLIVEPHEPTVWADAIRRLVDDEHLRRALGASARSTIQRRWTMEHSVEAWLSGVRLGRLGRARPSAR
jgi:glycosyltransferase involved in cell wall biosynthesis